MVDAPDPDPFTPVGAPDVHMGLTYRKLSTSGHPLLALARRLRRGVREFTLPAPRVVVFPVVLLFKAVTSVVHYLARIVVCEPYFKAHCTRCGRGVRTDIFLHWIQGNGRLIVGDDVLVDGKSSFSFAARYVDHPTLDIGDRTAIGHNCLFTVADRITIGRDCRLASDVVLFDSAGHASDPAARRTGAPAPAEEVRPIEIADNVWIGRRAIVFPGVTIGQGSIVSAGAVVISDVPPNTVVAGNPARKIGVLTPEERSE